MILNEIILLTLSVMKLIVLTAIIIIIPIIPITLIIINLIILNMISVSIHIILLANVAKGKPSKQSTTGPWGGVASRGNDGNANPNWSGRSCTATNRQSQPWWRVDLQAVRTIGKVRITNRKDCCWNRLRNVEVRIGTNPAGPAPNRLYV